MNIIFFARFGSRGAMRLDDYFTRKNLIPLCIAIWACREESLFVSGGMEAQRLCLCLPSHSTIVILTAILQGLRPACYGHDFAAIRHQLFVSLVLVLVVK